MKKSLLLIVLIVSCLMAEAQVQTPAASPAGSVSSTIGLTDVKVEYSRPRAKGRKIFGDKDALVPYGAIWRTGANNGTTITFSDDVKVEGIAVPKGQYLILTWPGATEWTVSLYKDVSIGGSTDQYDKTKDAANFKVKSEKTGKMVETFTISIDDIAADNKTGKVTLAWENTAVSFTVAVDYDAKVMKSIEANTKVSPGNYAQAANYYLETGKDLNQALAWANEAIKINPKAFWWIHLKAKIQAKMGDSKGARETANQSITIAKASENDFGYVKLNEDLLKTLK
jgi:hypothetical protein